MPILQRFYHQVSGIKRVSPFALRIFWAADSHVIPHADGDEEHEDAYRNDRLFYTAGQKLDNFVDDVNNGNPDLVYFGGDMFESYRHDDSPEFFMSKWNQINEGIKKELTIGNHDMAGGGDAIANTELADKLGYGDRSIIAGSKYNQSFYVENDHFKVKIISIDTNIDENGDHVVITAQLLKQPIRDWVKQELLNSESETVIIFSHGGPADNDLHFNEDDQLAFKNMIDDVANQRPELKMFSLFGHSHRQGVREYDTLGDNIRSFSITPVVDFETGGYAVAHVTNNGIEYFEYDLEYPYPPE